MGIPVPKPSAPTPTPPTGDRATAVITGTFTAVGPSVPVNIYGSFNVAIWASVATTITTTAGSLSATVASATGIVAGQSITAAGLPLGTTVGSITGTTVTLAVPPNFTAASIPALATVAATFVGTTVPVSATVNIERSFDGGNTWLMAGVGGLGVSATYILGTGKIDNPVSVVVTEPEQGVGYRLNCTTYVSGTINYRISATGLASFTWGINAQQ